jgi:hypothetical protein
MTCTFSGLFESREFESAADLREVGNRRSLNLGIALDQRLKFYNRPLRRGRRRLTERKSEAGCLFYHHQGGASNSGMVTLTRY